MLNTLKLLVRDEEGATMIEYGLMIALIALVAITAVRSLGTSARSLFNTAAGSV
jgi:pilus assembly protein Flp/PilA